MVFFLLPRLPVLQCWDPAPALSHVSRCLPLTCVLRPAWLFGVTGKISSPFVTSRRFSSPPLSLSSLSSVNMEGTAKQCWGWKQDLEGLSESNHFATRVAILSVSYHIWSAYTAATKHPRACRLNQVFLIALVPYSGR